MNYAIDISHYDARRYANGQYVYDQPTDWTRARASGVTLACIKSSEALGEDRGFRLNWSAAKGIVPRLAWHFIRHDVNAIRQAEFFLSLIMADFDPRTDFIALDAETLDGQSNEQCLKLDFSWLYEVGKVIPVSRTKYYINRSYWTSGNGPAAYAYSARKYGLWLADPRRYNVLDPMLTPDMLATMKQRIESGQIAPTPLAPWGNPEIWQFSWRVDPSAVPGHPGIKKAVDYNAVYLELAEPGPVVPVDDATKLARLWAAHPELH